MTGWLQEVSRRAGIDLWSDPIEARQVVTADGSILLVVGPLLVRTPETLEPHTFRSADGRLHCRCGMAEVERLAALDTEAMSPRAWPSRDDLRKMSPSQVNAFLASIGSDMRVRDDGLRTPETLDVERLTLAIDAVEWVNEYEARQFAENIAAEYDRLAALAPSAEPPETRCPNCDSGKRFHRGFAAGDAPIPCDDPWHDGDSPR